MDEHSSRRISSDAPKEERVDALRNGGYAAHYLGVVCAALESLHAGRLRRQHWSIDFDTLLRSFRDFSMARKGGGTTTAPNKGFEILAHWFASDIAAAIGSERHGTTTAFTYADLEKMTAGIHEAHLDGFSGRSEEDAIVKDAIAFCTAFIVVATRHLHLQTSVVAESLWEEKRVPDGKHA